MNTLYDDPTCTVKVSAMGMLCALGTIAEAWHQNTDGDPLLAAFICPVRVNADGVLDTKALITRKSLLPLWG